MENENNTLEYQVQDNSDIEGSVLAAFEKHYSNQNYEEALNLVLGVANTHANVDLYLNIGNCYFMLQNYDKAFEYWNKVVELDPKNSAAYAKIGNIYYKKGQLEKAISLWFAALVSKPEDAATSLNLAVAFNSKGMKIEAIKYFERYLKYAEDKTSEEYKQIKNNINSSFYMANEYLNLGMNLHNENQLSKASNCYLKAIEAYPNLAMAYVNLGSIFFADKQYELAIKYWTVSSHLDSKHGKSFSNLAISYDMMKQFDYAYCYYYRYMNFVINDKEEYYKANSRLVKIKPYLNENAYLIAPHLENANKYLANCQFYDAIDEYKNYVILTTENQATYKELIKKLESYLNPELDIIQSCFEKGNALYNSNRFSEAKIYYYRIMILSSPEYAEFSKAKSRFTQCEKFEGEAF